MLDLNTATQEVQQHAGMSSIIAMWLMREVPLVWRWLTTKVWPSMVSIYPFVSENGGVTGLVRNFWSGKNKIKTETNNEIKTTPTVV